jgi:hypothetical protein
MRKEWGEMHSEFQVLAEGSFSRAVNTKTGPNSRKNEFSFRHVQFDASTETAKISKNVIRVLNPEAISGWR